MALDVQEQIEHFQEFLQNNYENKIHEILTEGKKSIVLDFKELAAFDIELAEFLLNDPENATKAAEVALSQIFIPEEISLRIRFENLPESQRIEIRNIRSIHLNKFLAVDGIVRQTSDVRPQVTMAKFECPSCGNTISIIQVETRFKEPSRCTCGRRGTFRLIHRDLVDAQRLVIEEVPEKLEGGAQPKRISVFLKEDLVEPKLEKKTTPGAKIRVNGIVREVPIMLKTGAQSIRYDLMIDANFVEPIEETFEDVEISKEDEQKILELVKDPYVYEKLRNSIAPSIFGHENIKDALILQLMGGVKKEKKDGTKTRGNMHILLVGDPGSAKSTLLLSLSKVAPKARYVAGRGSSAAGLTASVVKDEFLKGWALEAGTLVLANGGYAMIDELDKISTEDTSALHEVLANEQVSIAKANIQATLRAETTLLSAANPKFGRFDPYQSIAAQINLPPALINRFDLIFTVRDIPNKDKDEKIASHVLETMRNVERSAPEIPNEFMKKYISYARQKCKPMLTDNAIKSIKEFYVNLRNSGSTSEEGLKSIPISARQLEAIVRLAEASARVRLAKKVSVKDTLRAIEIMTACLHQVGIDPKTGKMDIDMISTGIPASTRSKIVMLREIIINLSEKKGKTVAEGDIIEDAQKKDISETEVYDLLEKLKKEGELFEPKKGFICRI